MAKLIDKNAKKLWDLSVKRLREQTPINPFETKQEQADRIALAKKDYKYFVEYYLPNFATASVPSFHIKAANKVKRDKEIAIWLQWGRGLAKSVLADVAIPLWLWINDETKFFLLIGQNEDKAAILLDDLKLQFEGNERLKHDFGEQKNTGHWESGFFVTKNGFIAKSIGMGQDPRGIRVGAERPDLIVPDDWETKDTLKNPKRQKEYADWLLTGILPTMDGERQRVILAQNKFAPRMIFDIVIDENKGWEVFRQNAFDPKTLKPLWDKYADDYYKKRIEKMGILHVKAEYNNDPHVEGKIFTDEMIQWTKLPRLDSFDTIVGMWDVAFAGSKTSDFNAVRVWGLKNNYKYLIDCFVKRSKMKAAIEWIARYQIALPKTVKVHFKYEKQFHNDEIERTITDIEQQFKIVLNLSKGDREKGKKYDRMLEMHPQYQNGRIFYNANLRDHNDTKEGLAQLKSLEPHYKTNDDAPDADKYAFDYLDAFDKSSSHYHRVAKRESRKY